jgi:lipopolysaccharide export LptBFGC system permease protein LptF
VETILSSKLEVMAYINIDDVKFRKSQLDDKLITLDQLVTTFQQKTRATDELQKTKQHAEDALGELETKGKDADSAAETYDREFLDRKDAMGDTFKAKRNPTIQDFTFSFFWISFLLFAIAMLLVTYFSSGSLKQTGYMALFLSIVAFFVFGMVLRYA